MSLHTSIEPGTTHAKLAQWVAEVAEMTTPDEVRWVTGSAEEWTELTNKLVAAGTFTRLNEDLKPNSFHAASSTEDVARVEERTFICSRDEKDAGPTNNWMNPEQMKDLMRGLYTGCMKGRTMYVIPFVMGHVNADNPMFGVEITDSEYVVVSMRVMARCGSKILDRIEELGDNARYVPALHSVGAPLADG
ncbi:MAG: phosphoenolpyruvate carboxykinase, partial [Allobranchiibius sp.]